MWYKEVKNFMKYIICMFNNIYIIMYVLILIIKKELWNNNDWK